MNSNKSTTSILALDVSSSYIGYAHFAINLTNCYSLQEASYLLPGSSANITSAKAIKSLPATIKLYNTQIKITELFQRIQPTHIYMEKHIPFLKNKSSANTIITLAVYNQMVQTAAYTYFLATESPLPAFAETIAIQTIRAKLKNIYSLPAPPHKEDLPALFKQNIPNYPELTYNRNGKLNPQNYDIADATAVGLTAINKFHINN